MKENANGKKKILFCITKGNFGGAQRYVFDVASNLPREQFEVVVACGPGDLLKQRCKEAKIEVVDLQNSEREINLRNELKTVRELVGIIRKEKPNIVHFNSSKIGFLGALAILYFRVLNLFRISNLEFRALFTSHGWAFNEQHRSSFARLIFYIAHYFTVLVCDKSIAVSEKTKKDIAWLPFAENKITVVHNGIKPFKTLTNKEASEILIKKDGGQNIILTLAELHHNKGIDVALKAISGLPEKIKESIAYYIAGDGEERKMLEKLSVDLNIQNLVHFLGFIEDAKKLLSGATIFLFPSRTENLPYAVLEAGFSGLPIIASSVGGIPEIIRDMQNGILVHPKNPKEIAEGILYLLDHKEKQKEFGMEIKKTITNFFTLEKMIRETVALYR